MKTPLLLLHGALGASSNFDQVIETLSDHFDVHTLDFDGHGNKAATIYSVPQYVRNVMHYLDDHDILRCHVFGYSMGGYVALKAAAEHGERFKTILTLGTKFNWSEEATDHETRLLDPEKMKDKIPHYVEALGLLHTEFWEDVVKGTADLMRRIAKNDKLTSEDLVNIKNHVIIGLGDEDKMVTKEESLAIANELPNAEFKLLKHCPHPLEKVPIKVLTQFILDSL